MARHRLRAEALHKLRVEERRKPDACRQHRKIQREGLSDAIGIEEQIRRRAEIEELRAEDEPGGDDQQRHAPVRQDAPPV
ncbi:hypothetical protein D3C80_1781440 [compost metagenome]